MRIVITKMGDITNVKCISRTGGDSSIFEFHTTGDVTVDDQRERVNARRERPRRSPGRCAECGMWAEKDGIGAWVIRHAETCSLHESNRSD
jgi:hypothetical protein